MGGAVRGGVGEWRSDSPGGKDSGDRWEGAERSLGQPLPRVLKQTKENGKKEQRNQLVSTHRSNSLLRIHSSVRVTAGVPRAAVNPQPVPHPSSAAPPTLPSKPPTLGPPPLQTGTRSRTAVTEIRARSGFVGALPGGVGEGRAPRDPRRRRAGASPPGSPAAPRVPPPPPHPQDALTSSSSQSLRAWYWNRGRPPAPPPPPPRSRGAAASAWAPRGLGPAPSSSGPWPPRRRLASGGAGKDREVLILPVNLWYSEAIGPRALSLAVFGAFLYRLSPSGAPAPHALRGEKGRKKKGRRRRRKGRRQRAAPPARHSRVAAERPPGSASSAPSPAAGPSRGLAVCSRSRCFSAFNSSARPRTA